MAEPTEPKPGEAVIFTYAAQQPGAEKPWIAALDQTGPGRYWMATGRTEDEARANLLAFLTPTHLKAGAKVKGTVPGVDGGGFAPGASGPKNPPRGGSAVKPPPPVVEDDPEEVI